jgi:hypothetical protein
VIGPPRLAWFYERYAEHAVMAARRLPRMVTGPCPACCPDGVLERPDVPIRPRQAVGTPCWAPAGRPHG